MDLLTSIPLIGPILQWVLPFLIVLSVVVAIHELGHLMVGRWCGIKAEVYSIGFGKTIWSRTDRHGTTWQVAALPLGGFVKFLGDMDPASAGRASEEEIPPEDRHRAFHNAALWKRALTVAAGPVANFLLSIILIFFLALHVGHPSPDPVIADLGDYETVNSDFKVGDRILEVDGQEIRYFGEALSLLLDSAGKPVEVLVERDGQVVTLDTRYTVPARIESLVPDGAALVAGLIPGDIVTKINGIPIRSTRDLQITTANLPHNEEIAFEILRGDETKEIRFTPQLREREHPETGEMQPLPFLGVRLAVLSGIMPEMQGISYTTALETAVDRVWQIVADTMLFVHRILFEGAGTKQLSGPVGIAKHSTDAAHKGVAEFVFFIAFVSTAIGLFNLFPIPVLDGGHLFFYLIELVRGRPTNATIVRYSSFAGLSLLLLLMVFVTFNNDLGLGDLLSQN